jgi:hypothetical protein
MSSAKKFGLKLLAGVFAICIFGLATVTSVNSVFGKPEPLKQALQEGGVYPAIADAVVEEVALGSTKQTGVQLNSQLAQTAAKQVITPDLVKTNVEKIIDGTYAWLDGTTPTPDFRVTTASIQDQVAANVSNVAVRHVQSLPPCTPAQLQQIDLNNLDPFSIKCEPQGLDFAALKRRFRAEVAAGQTPGAVQDKAITAADLTNDQGQNVFAAAEQVPTAFQRGQQLPWAFVAGALLSGAGVVFLRPDRRRGLKTVSITLLVTGLFLLVASLLSSGVLNMVKPDLQTESVAVQNASVTVIKTLNSALVGVLLLFAGVYIALGGGGLIGLRLTKPKTPTPKQPAS